MSKTIIVTEQQLNQMRGFFSENKSLVSDDNELIEDITIPVTTGDTVMMGKFKNKKTVIKSIDKDKHGMPKINGKQATTFRLIKEKDSTKNSFRVSLKHLLSKPNQNNGFGFFSDERLIDKFENKFKYTTNRGVDHYETVYVYKSKNGVRYLVSDDNLETIDAAAFVNNENVLTGIITDFGMVNVGIGKNLLKIIKGKIPNLKIDDLQSVEGKRLFGGDLNESKDNVRGNYKGRIIDVGNEAWDAVPFICSNNKVWVGYTPSFGETYKDDGYLDDNGENEYPNFHSDIEGFYYFINKNNPDYKLDIPMRSGYEYFGRVWLDEGVISFYRYPEDNKKMKQVISLLNKELYNVYGETFDFSEFIVDTTNDGLVSMKDYIGSENASDDVINSPHLLPSDQKKNNSQFKSVLDAKYDHIGKKLGNVTQAGYNHYKRYGMGENKNSLIEITTDEVNLSSFKTREELNPKFWESDERVYSRIRRRLLKIADDFIEFIKIDDKFCKDVLLLGSLANYTWSKHSDVDLHILVDFKKVNKNIGFVKDYFDSKRFVWNQDHDDLKIYGFPVEIYVQDINEVNSSAGIYSLEKNKWIKKPVYSDEELLDTDKIRIKSADLINKIDELEKDFNKGKSDIEKISEKTKKLHDKIKALRKDGLKTKQGEYSVGNIVFKVLRRGGYIEKLIDIKRSSYDKINSLK